MNCLQIQSWPEPVVRVQTLSESGIRAIPERYVKPPSHRPSPSLTNHENHVNIPVIDLGRAMWGDGEELRRVEEACKEWGFFQVVNHGVSPEVMRRTREVWREFFEMPVEVKQVYANSPATYEGYGSRLGVEKGAILDWSDYFFLHFMPSSLRNPSKWPLIPQPIRDLVNEYGKQVVELGGQVLKVLSKTLGLEEDYLMKAFGGEENIGACMRVNFYPKCPQPDLTLGLSSHSDPGGMTVLLPDDDVAGLQVLKGDSWLTVKPLPNSFIVNIGDQIQVMSNAIYKSVEHRVVVNSAKDRVSIAFFYNPKSDLLIQPFNQLVTNDRPSLYPPMTYDEYRLHIRLKGPCGKQQVESLKSPK